MIADIILLRDVADTSGVPTRIWAVARQSDNWDEMEDPAGREECGQCHGRGITDCNYCDGDTDFEPRGDGMNCPVCGGDGKMVCPNCDGSGFEP